MRRCDVRTLFCVWRKEISNPQKAQKKIRAPGEKGTHDPTLLTSARLVPMFDCYVSVKLAAVLYYSVNDERACCSVFDCYVTDNAHTKLRLYYIFLI